MPKVSLDFCETVYDMVQLIPKGFVLGYKDVAHAIGYPKRARHVGFALSVVPADRTNINRFGCVPWWRVIRSDGSIAMQGSITRGRLQKKILQEENIVFHGQKVAMKIHRWKQE